ncbi:MAG: hypothetical protein MK212_16225 [Saprospiraceae bacterium]|nr:hypothetical protein [Saprospiraceae bacterium]
MLQHLRYSLCLMVTVCFLANTAQAQFVNFETTWKEFLQNTKASDLSNLTKPAKDDTKNYLKYCLMYATDRFCANEVIEAEKLMTEVRSIGATKYDEIPDFAARFTDLTAKIKAYHKTDVLWKRFLEKRNVDLSELKENATATKVCEKGTLAKHFHMTSHAHYCEGNLDEAKKVFESRTLKLAEKTSLKISDVEGLEAEVKMMKRIFRLLGKLEPAWKEFVSTDKSPGFSEDFPLIECYPIPSIKVYLLRAGVDPCKNGSEMLEKIRELQDINSHPLSSDIADKIKWLEDKVGSAEKDLAKLNKAWKEFTPKDKLDRAIDFPFNYPCHKDAQMKAYIMDGMTNFCEIGPDRMKDIEKLQKEFNPELDALTANKLKRYKDRLANQEKRLADLNAAWKEFVPSDQLKNGVNFEFEYCDKAAQIKAYVMDGTVNFCEKGEKRMEDISATLQKFTPELDATTKEKVENLKAKVEEAAKDVADLNNGWKLFMTTDKNVEIPKEGYPQPIAEIGDQMRLVDFYCDKIAQTKSWVIKGHLDPCAEGANHLKKIDALKKKHNLSYNTELACQVKRLRSKVYQCRYWKLVLQARKETHEERERFGPASAKIMYGDLNSDKLPCETKVLYEPLGNIGIKYTIETYLCERINLAKMGDPEYYKKIAAWVDTEVLQKYCEANMRCKKDFFIYLEGHTDGNPFSGRTYKESLGIPSGTPFTHFVDGDTLSKTTRNITTKLENNMELGIARAWTVKQQLDFMAVPIKVGAYEHPSKERGGEYRKISIQLNITNLLLDFYEKRLEELMKEEGLGDRPPGC